MFGGAARSGIEENTIEVITNGSASPPQLVKFQGIPPKRIF